MRDRAPYPIAALAAAREGEVLAAAGRPRR
jgi:hypothetical protein